MVERKNMLGPTVPPETFIEQVKQALEHLHDYSYLQRHSLAQAGGFRAERSGETAGQHLRRELIVAIETLQPGSGVPFRASHARPYNLLHLHYIEGLTVQEAGHKLGISLRQAHRDLRRGEESVATILEGRRAAEPRAIQLSSVQAEIARLETRPRPIDVRMLIQHAQKAVEQLALKRGVNFQIEIPAEPVIVSIDPVVAQQVLVNVLSYAVQQVQPGELSLTLRTGPGQGSVVLSYSVESEVAHTIMVNHVVAHLADRLGWLVWQENEPAGKWVVTVEMTSHGPTVLVIDDNEGLVELLDRYLTGHACRVMAATSSREGLQLAQELAPNAIVLDVMMPEMDGWELLQRLRTHPQTANIPVVICSVFNDPELAFSLGASLFLSKPVSRDNVLTALSQLGVM